MEAGRWQPVPWVSTQAVRDGAATRLCEQPKPNILLAPPPAPRSVVALVPAGSIRPGAIRGRSGPCADFVDSRHLLVQERT